MDGFRDGVHGYRDVADELFEYLRRCADPELAAARDAKDALDSPEAFEARRDSVRRDFLDAIGGLPDRPRSLDAKVTGTLTGDAYAVERVVFESRPDFHVTANCYAPAADGPHPAVLFLCGHVPEAKADALNQRTCAELASNGVVVLVVDSIAQGERTQYPDADAQDVLRDSGVYGHAHAGQQCHYAGANVARYLLHDARCGFDYLVNRADVDAERIAVAGTSSGGVQAGYLALVDDRVAAALLCCCTSTRAEMLRTGISLDDEQVPHGAIANGIGYDDFVTALAPRPVCVGAAASDFFPVEGVEATVERAREVYDLYDAEGNLDLVVRDGTHSAIAEFGTPVYEWLCDALDAGDYEPIDGFHPRDEAALDCTPGGDVLDAYPHERTVTDLVADDLVPDQTNARGDGGTGSGHETDAAALRERVTETLGLERDTCARRPRFVTREESGGLDVRRVFFRTEHDPDITVTGLLVTASNAAGDERDAGAPAVVLFEDGTEEAANREGDVASLVAEHGTVLVFDPRGVGAVRNRELPDTWVTGDYDDVYGSEYTLSRDASFLGESLFGMRVFDVGQAVAFLREETGCEDVALVGEGVGAYHALYAAAAARNVSAVDLRDLGPSFRERGTTADRAVDPRLDVYDVLDCDVPDALAALSERGVAVRRD
ncbi:alpha/beta hydrolase family protein [Halocalculus aciditolerans]|uniref:Acetyl xylan esterase domain-containing protein n=1 Tax=Halocalculus aciditolerans TaxID=1383812 RepID=A0A830F7G4_9EURY|nr:acetylxylan esterase [Halocalculus aciditolerans]GGL61875.1 hypothetical protein GCM10009039_20120 [Halocalculus aciditolerans]